MHKPLPHHLIDTIIHGDCCELIEALPNNSVPLVLTSPPYGNMRSYGGHAFDAKAIIKGICRVVQPGGVVVWVEQDQVRDLQCSGNTFENYQRFRACGVNFVCPIVLNRRGMRQSYRRHYGSPEFALVFSKGMPRYCSVIQDRRNKTAGRIERYSERTVKGTLLKRKQGKKTKEFGPRHPVWEYLTGGVHSSRDPCAFEHPAIMAESIAEDLIISFSRPGELVFDPMVGSGTTAKMAILNHRRFLGFEINEPYVKIARERVRIAQTTVQQRLDASWGEFR